MSSFVQEWNDAVGAASEWPRETIDGASPISKWINRVRLAGDALAKDYEKLVIRANREGALAVRLHTALAEVVGNDNASRICDGHVQQITREQEGR